MDYLVRNIGGVEDTYAIAVTTYALHLALHPTKEAAFNLLEAKAQSDSEYKWWNRTLPAAELRNPWHTRPNSLAVEMTSYALLTYLQRGLVNDALPIMHWLVAQRNANGGFVSTQVISVFTTRESHQSVEGPGGGSERTVVARRLYLLCPAGHGDGHAGAGRAPGAHLGAAGQRRGDILVPRGRRPHLQHQHQPRQLHDPSETGGTLSVK